MTEDYQRILTFLGEAEKLKSTLRHNWTTTGRQEDSAQHSWRAALFFIIMHELRPLDVDPYKTIMMLLIHDLPETGYGDIPGFVKDTNVDEHTQHKLREAEAAKQLYALLPSSIGEKFTALQEEFERGETKEARAAKALEKVESQLQHLESGPHYWSDEERGEHMLTYPDKAVDTLADTHIAAVWKLIRAEIHKITYPT